MSDIARLRKELKQRVQAANRKVNRLEKQGIEITGTEFDPRRENPRIDRYNSNQVESYRAKLDAFVDRKNRFVGDTRGRPIPRSEWQAYKRAESRANRKSDNAFNKIKDVYVPSAGQTIAQREASTKSEFPRTANPAVNSPFNKITRKPEQLASRKALEALTKQQQAKVDPRYMEQFVADGRVQLEKMMKVINRPEMQERFDKLTTKQFHLIWGYTNAADDLSTDYEIITASGKGKSNKSDEKLQADSLENVSDILDWVSKIK